MIVERNVVLVVGSEDIGSEPFLERRLSLKPVKFDELTDDVLSTAKGIIIAEPLGQFRLISQFFDSHFARAGAFGLCVAVPISAAAGIQRDDTRTQISKIKDAAYERIGLSINDRTRSLVSIGRGFSEIAETIARHSPGPPLGSPKLVYLDPDTKLSSSTEFLLRRAFFDCSSITIEQMTGGKTAKAVLRIFATRADQQYGRQVLPFFFKHGERDPIASENDHYNQWVKTMIPFHLHPAISEDRSVETLTEAALVGDFVEGGAPLRDMLRGGHGVVGIFSLFEVTLRGLRAQAMCSDKQRGPLHRFLKERIRVNEIIQNYPERINRARNEMGFTADVGQLEERLLAISIGVESHHGIVHGDCHAGNVLLRQRDAVVIDFGSMGDFPLSVDPAILEVSLVFSTDKGDDPRFFDDWVIMVRALFIDNPPHKPPKLTDEHPRFSWLLNAVRELRHIIACSGAEELEHKLVLAGTLLRFARLSESLKGELVALSEKRRAYALVVAQHLCDQLPVS